MPGIRVVDSRHGVSWHGDHDELNPMNWPAGKKWRITAVVSLMTFITPLASSMFAPGVTQVMNEFHTTSIIFSEMVVTMYVLGFAIGLLIVGPLSESYGRKPVYLVSCFVFIAFTIACAASSDLSMLITFRFLAGCAGSTPTVLGVATIGNMFTKEERGGAMALWGVGPQLAPAVGPVIGGFLTESKGWRWVFWLQAIVSGVVLILGIILLRETYAPVILQKKLQTMMRTTGDQSLRSSLHHPKRLQNFTGTVLRLMKILLLSPIVSLLSLYVSVLFGYLYLFIATFQRGLMYLGLGFGSFLGLLITGKTSDLIYSKLPLTTISLFLYGWSANAEVYWIVPIIGSTISSIGMIPAFISINMYLVDTFGKYSASALAASKILQSIVGAFLPLAGRPLYNYLGLGWGNSVLGLIALVLIPIPWLFFKYGADIRSRFITTF
ncbi:major facilitator superfamily domain-containing protein [Xylariales sp. PMI_506]|nr:major facilitator superfamily domain-containing protein [Xylariales sp. PMI_506]